MSWIQEKGLASLVAELEREEPHLDFEILRSAMEVKNRRQGHQGITALMLAVLDDGVRSYLSSDKGVAKEAAYWVHSDKRRSPFSFVHVCGVFGLDLENVRQALKHLREQADAAKTRSRTD